MTLGDHFYVGIPGTVLDSATQRLLKEVRPAGIILFGRNVKSPKQLANLTHRIRSLLGSKVLICLDHEGGRVNRLKELVGVVPSAYQLGFLGEEKWAQKHGQLTGRLLSEFGVNVNLAPVLDLLLRPNVDNSVPDRCWSRDPKEVSRLAGAFLGAMQKEGVFGCGKHFLGYGAADKDPHLVLPRVTRTRQQVLKEDLVPYSKLLPSSKLPVSSWKSPHLQMIMLSHAHLRAFHGNKLTPACISPIVNGSLLRETLGFRGVTITDDLEMGAITRTMSIGKATVRCLDLGTDLILICHTAKAIREGYHAARKAFRDRPDHPELNRSAERIRALRSRLTPSPKFSERRFNALCRDIHAFTRKIFSKLPAKLQVIDSRWGAIGEKY
jgi:beta-N-acetylhexosaminidase